MKIAVVTPAPPGSRSGNRVTARRWADIFKQLGHRASVIERYDGEDYDLLIALHARRSHGSIKRFSRERPRRPLVVALTGTDLYRDLKRGGRARQSLDLASRVVVLQPAALDELKPEWRRKARVIFQSVEPPDTRPARGRSNRRHFDVCVVGHLRAVKDPFRAAMAVRLLPADSRVRVLHVGGAMTAAMAARARREMLINPRYHWLGERTRAVTLRLLARSELCVLSSKLEGGANVLGEAVAASVPVLASRVPGSVGILGRGYAGYFEVGDTRALAALIARAASDARFLDKLRAQVERLQPLFEPTRERAAWRELLGELAN
jgi:putative glycosyltransferase (TIGR04348 family)